MSLTHEFILLTEEECNREIVLNRIKDCKEVIEIHDDIIQYIYDTLKWIPQKNTNSLNHKKYGLN